MTACSAVALGLVMYRHAPTLPKFWLLDWGVPWFFFASGFWWARKSDAGSMGLKKRVKTLLVPYFAWNLIWFPILALSNWIGWKYCGAPRVVDGSWPCVIRCLGLSPFAWPALVPTWFLRALFMVVAVIGISRGRRCGRARGLGVMLAAWAVYWTYGWWMPASALWHDFFVFGVSLSGCAWFATGCEVGELVPRDDGVARERGKWVLAVRRQMMPVYVLHAAVIVIIGWIAKALGLWPHLATTAGDVVMWCAGIAGAVAIGEAMRKWMPKAAHILFGGR